MLFYFKQNNILHVVYNRDIKMKSEKKKIKKK